ncbi:MAG: DUF2202 domain-containing protein, partial [Anaerolineales bacterium]|nr:DUF2202 domain-containing protein [Anaerolineales bacterium]
MKRKTLFILSLVALSALLLGACAPPEAVSALSAPVEPTVTAAPIFAEASTIPTNNGYGGNQYHGNGSGNRNINATQQQDCVETQNFIAAGELSQPEVDRLIFMREEEKLARDVYLTLYEQWNLSAFQNISSSEQKHTDAVKNLLDLYELADPVVDDTIGVFTNNDLQALYDQLVAQGSLSLADALNVGAAIEEIDILDLQEGLDEANDPNIVMVYNNLMNGSYHHL